MNYIIEGHSYKEEVFSLIQMFYPNESFNITDKISDTGITVKNVLNENMCFSYVFIDGKKTSEFSVKIENENIKEIKRCIKISLYYALEKIKKIYMPWGIITGIRPTKRIIDMWEQGYSDANIKKELKEKYLVSDEKIDITMKVAHAEEKILKNKDTDKEKISLYIGIPFCPTICLYCSFTSYTISQYKEKIDLYLNALEKEFKFILPYLKKYNIESIYVGGGTPTSLDGKQLEKLLFNINKYFEIPLEFTFEAGRPDTVTREKLSILKKYNVNRISINPQTMNDKTLEIIGRKHTKDDFINAFFMAREEGHEHINTDIILGLPSEDLKDVENTLKGISELKPESMTVHTLAVKRASRLKETLDKYKMADAKKIDDMIKLSMEYANNMSMFPYYLYRQKNMIGNFENVGYCTKGNECIYNIQIMEEKQTIIAFGAGGSTKLYYPESNRVERIFNVKNADEYINRIDEMIQRKMGGLK